MLDCVQHLRDNIGSMRYEQAFHDVVFIIENERFSAHRCVTAAASPVLHALVAGCGGAEQEILLEQVNVGIWEVLLDYMYSGKIKLSSVEDALEYWESARYLQMEKLEAVLLGYIKRELNQDNCCKVLATAHRLDSNSLEKEAMKTIFSTFKSQCGDSGFTELPYELVVEILQSDKLMVCSELDVFVAAVNWTVRSTVTNMRNAERKSEIFDRVSELLIRHELCAEGIELTERVNHEKQEANNLFEYVNIDNLSVFDLQRMGRFCRDVSEKVRPPRKSSLQHMQKLVPKVFNKLLAPGNLIPNIPTASRHRVAHGRYDKFFTLSHQFYKIQKFLNPISKKSPEFVDELNNMRWYVEVYSEDTFNNLCFRLRGKVYDTMKLEGNFSAEMIITLHDSNAKLDPLVLSVVNSSDEARNYVEKSSERLMENIPLTELVGKDEITIGVTIYRKTT